MKFLTLLVILLLGTRIQAEKWYFAWDERDFSFIAFTASGEKSTIGPLNTPYQIRDGYRLNSAGALFTLHSDGQIHGLYYLSPDGLTQLSGEIDLDLVDDQGFDVLAYDHPYVIIRLNDCDSQPCGIGRTLWAANVDALTISVISGNAFVEAPQPLGLSGHLLRYARRDSPDSETWRLRERDLQTGDERDFYTFTSPIEAAYERPISLRTDSTGEYWLHNEPTVFTNGENPEYWRRLIRSDGGIDVLDHIPGGEIPETKWTLTGDLLLRQPVECSRACRLDVRPVSGGEWQTFTISDNGYFDFVRLLPDGRALARQYHSMAWIVRENGSPLRLGYAREGSPDNAWLLTLHDPLESPTPYRVWDLQNERVALEGIAKDGIRAQYFDGGFFIYQFSQGMGQVIRIAAHQQVADPPPALLYRHIDGKTFDLPYSNYFDVLPDGSYLESNYGIYRIDPESGAETQILAAAGIVNLR